MGLHSSLEMESARFQWMDWLCVQLTCRAKIKAWAERVSCVLFLPRFLTSVYFGTSVLEINLLIALGSPYMTNWEFRCMWTFVTLKWLHLFPDWDQGSGDFSCSPVLSFCWKESNHLLFLYHDRMWLLNAPVPLQLGSAVQHLWGIFPWGEIWRCSPNGFTWDFHFTGSSIFSFFTNF